jgi:dTDP-4-amino-4,6-dideoxygalactose transaminase
MATTPLTVPILDLAAELAPIRAEVERAFARVLDSGQFVLGPEVEAFETEAADFLDVPHAVAVNSGTDALLIALRALGVGPGDEVITTPLSFFATSEVVQLLGATPVFVDVREEGLAIDPELVAGAVTERTRALLPVHLFGDAAPLTRLLGVARSFGLSVVEDAAQAFGARYAEPCSGCVGACDGARDAQGRALGTIGDVGAFSFYPTKNLGAMGDGGLLVTRDADVAATARALRNHASVERYRHQGLGYNSRLDALQAAVLRVKLAHLPTWTEARREVAARYDALLEGIPGVRRPPRSAAHVYHQYTVRLDRADRDAVAASMRAEGVATTVHYPRTLDAFGGRAHGSLARAHAAARSVLSLPLYPTLDEAAQSHVAAALARAVRDHGEP